MRYWTAAVVAIFLPAALGEQCAAADLYNIVHRRRTKVYLVKQQVYKPALVTQQSVAPRLVNRYRVAGGDVVKTATWQLETRVTVRDWKVNVTVHVAPETAVRVVGRRPYGPRIIKQDPVSPVGIVKSFPSLEKD